MRYRKVVDAFRVDGSDWPDWARELVADGTLTINGTEVIIPGDIAKPGDWITRDESGYLEVIGNAEFVATYVQIDAPPEDIADDDLSSDEIAARLEAAFLEADGSVST